MGIHEYVEQAKLIDIAFNRGMINQSQQKAKLEADWKHYTGLDTTQQCHLCDEMFGIHHLLFFPEKGGITYCCSACYIVHFM